MKYGDVLCGATLLGVMLATPALAQQAKRFDVRASVQAQRDDNVSRSNALVAALRGVEQEDTLIIPNISTDIYQPIGRQAIFANANVGYNFYEKNDQLNRERLAIRGGGIARFSSCQFTLTGDYGRRQSDLQDLAENVSKNVEDSTGVTIDSTCGRAVGFAPSLSVGQKWTENSAPQRATSDQETTSVTLGLAYRRPTFGEVMLYGSYGSTDYDRYTLIGADLHRDGYELYSGGLQYTRRLGARLEGSVSAGYSSVRANAPAGKDFDGVVYGADLTFRPSGRIEATASFKRSAQPSMKVDTTYQIEEIYSLQGSYAIGSRLKLGLGGDLRDSSYERSAFIVGPTPITEEQVRTIFTSLTFRLGDRLSFILDASQQERDANIPGFDYTANRVGLTVSANY